MPQLRTRTLITLMLSLLLSVAALAQLGPLFGGKPKPPTVDDQLKQLTKHLKLSDEQKPQVRAILEDQSKQMKEIMDSASDPRDAMPKVKEIDDKYSARIRELLTDEQRYEFDKMEKKKQERMERGPRAGLGSL